MKIYQFEFNCDKETAIKEVLHGTEKPKLLFEDYCIYAKQWGSFVNLYHGITYQNSFRPIFTACFKEVEPGKTVVKGLFRWNWFVTLFSIVWLSVVIYAAFCIGFSDFPASLTPLFFILFFVGLIAFCTYLERKNRKNIIDHIKMHQRIINGDI